MAEQCAQLERRLAEATSATERLRSELDASKSAATRARKSLEDAIAQAAFPDKLDRTLAA